MSMSRTRQRLRGMLAGGRRVAPGPGMVRVTVVLLGMAGMLLTMPGALRASPWTYPVLVVLAGMPAARPDSPWPTVLELVMVGEWLLDALLYHADPGPVGMLVVAALLYAHHTGCTLAAAVGLSARLAPGVLLGWLLRTGGAVLAAVLLVALVLLVLPPAGTGRSVSAVPLLGLAAAVGAGVVFVWLLHRRR